MRTKSSSILPAAVALALILIPFEAAAGDRSWARLREQVVDLNGAIVAEQTRILTLDGQSPTLHRILLEDIHSGRLYVVRRSVAQSGPVSISLELVGSGTIFSLTSQGGQGVFSACNVNIAFNDATPAEQKSSAVLSATDVLLDSCPNLRSHVERMIVLGLQYDENVHDVGYVLRSLFHDFAPVEEMQAGRVQRVGAPTRPFDPATHPPDAHEQRFGSAYME